MTRDLPDNVVQDALDEMDYRTVESQFHKDGVDVSIPAQLEFTEEPVQDTQQFHDALESHGYVSLDTDPARGYSGESPRYDGELASDEHYQRIRVCVFRRNVVRIFPHDDYVPTSEELSNLLSAIEIGFDAPLEHNPIDRDDD